MTGDFNLMLSEHLTEFFFRLDWTCYVKVAAKESPDVEALGETFARRLAKFVESENKVLDGLSMTFKVKLVGGVLTTKSYERKPNINFDNNEHSEKPS